MTSVRAVLLVLAATPLLAGGCTSRAPAPPASAGRRVVEGQALLAAPSPDGTRVAWLGACSAAPGPAGAPPGCRLLVADLAGGAPAVVAEGVAPAAGAFAWAADGSLAALSRRDPVSGEGDLVAWRGGTASVWARRASGFASGPGGELAVVSGGALLVAPAGGAAAPIPGGAGASGPVFAPAPGRALAAVAPGPDGSRRLLLWRNAGGEPVVVAEEPGPFAFSGDGAVLGAVAGVAPGKAGTLVTVATAGGAPETLASARDVGEFRWAPRARTLAWLSAVDARVRAGTLAVALPGGPPAAFGPGVTSFDLSPDGQRVAFVRHVTEGGYSARLELSPAGAPAAGTLSTGVAGHQFSPDGKWIWWRAACSPAGDACSLFRAPATGLGPSQSPERVAEGVSAVVLDGARPDRALVAFPRSGDSGVDLAAWGPGKLVPLDSGVVPGSARFLPPDGRRALYAVQGAGRTGLFVVDVP
jgi:hypothetical protein